jgi:hypothetical protein
LNDNLAQWVRRKQQLDRAAGGALTRRRNRVKVLISQGGHVAIPVFIAPFCEERDDDVSLPWLDGDGNQRHLKMPPYLVDDTDLASRLKACVTEHRRDYVDRFLSTANPIARKVFAKADRYAQRHKVVTHD